MEEKKLNSKRVFIVVFISVIFIVGLGGYFYFKGSNPITNNIKVQFPYASNVANNTSFACESLLSASIIGSPEEYLTNGIEGSVQKGTDKVAMNIKDSETLSLLTAASIEAGTTEGDNFKIVQNNDQKLMAFWFNENVISTVVINKNNGLAIWLKGNPDFILYGAPHGQVIYMVCR